MDVPSDITLALPNCHMAGIRRREEGQQGDTVGRTGRERKRSGDGGGGGGRLLAPGDRTRAALLHVHTAGADC